MKAIGLAIELVEKLNREKYFGKLIINYENGQVISIRKDQVLKIEDLAEIVKK